MDRSQQEFQRATRITAAASMGSMLVISAFAAGISHAAASGGTSSSFPVASTGAVSPTASVAKAVVQSRVSSSVAATAPTCANTYVVRPGDYWLRLANAATVDVAALYRANGATPATPLRSGQTICLPVGAHVVVPATTAAAVAAPVTAVATPKPAPPKPAAKKVVAAKPVAATPVTAAHTTHSSH
jgi:LysM repeat protein